MYFGLKETTLKVFTTSTTLNMHLWETAAIETRRRTQPLKAPGART